MKWFLPLAFLLLLHPDAQAQDYRMSAGVYSGYSRGISVKYFNDLDRGVEGLLSFRNYGVQVTGMIQHYRMVDERFRGLIYWFYGYGLHTGYYTRPYTGRRPSFISDQRFFRPSLGGDFITGVQYNLEAIPLSLSLEFKPYLDVFGVQFMHFRFWDVGVGIRYNFD